MKVGINQLCELTGMARATIKRRLDEIPSAPGPNRSKLYDSSRALSAIYHGGEAGSGETLDPQQEKAKLDQQRRLVVELDRAEREGRLVDIETVAAEWEQAGEIFKSRILGIPSRLGASLVGIKTAREIEDTLLAALQSALSEIAGDCDARAVE